jgi:MraZ protein
MQTHTLPKAAGRRALVLSGRHVVTVDPRGRLVLPARIRERFREGAYVVQGQESGYRFLLVLDAEGWDRMAEAELERAEEEVNIAATLLGSKAHYHQPDSQGRVFLRRDQRRYLGLPPEGGTVVVVGFRDRAMVWRFETYREMLREREGEEAAADLETELAEAEGRG